MASNAPQDDARTATVTPTTRANGAATRSPTSHGPKPPVGPPRPETGAPARQRAGAWLDRLAGMCDGWDRGARQVLEFTDLIANERDPTTVQAALVRAAGELAGAGRVELVLDRDDAHPEAACRLLALWPEAARAQTPSAIEALGYPLAVGLWCGDHYEMSLQIYVAPGRKRRFPERQVRRLRTLGSVAAAALRGLHAGRRARVEKTPGEPTATVRDATFLSAILPYALAQAQRHDEPVVAFCVEIDRLVELSRAHGPDALDRAVGRLADAIARALRGSDVVARLDDDRIIIVLPNTGPRDAPKVAEIVRVAAAAACLPVGTLPALRASLGTAHFPDDARDSAALLSAADAAMSHARAQANKNINAHMLYK